MSPAIRKSAPASPDCGVFLKLHPIRFRNILHGCLSGFFPSSAGAFDTVWRGGALRRLSAGLPGICFYVHFFRRPPNWRHLSAGICPTMRPSVASQSQLPTDEPSTPTDSPPFPPQEARKNKLKRIKKVLIMFSPPSFKEKSAEKN